MDNNHRSFLILDGFWLKILALLTMTIDHVGFFIPSFSISIIFRYIGRLALPLFCFMIAEGVVHTKNIRKYTFRLGLMASIISIGIICSEYIPFLKDQGFSMRNQGIIFLDLLLGALAVYLLTQKKWYIKLLVVLPLLFSVASFIANSLESCGCYGPVLWFPFFIRTQYGFFAVLLCIGFYFSRLLADLFIRIQQNITGVDINTFPDSNVKRHTLNIFSLITLIFSSIILYVLGFLLPVKFVYWDVEMQLFEIFSGVFILLYNGRRGYNKVWFQYGSYLYYPLHFAVLYIIFSIF